jgi:hypothetical protein
MKYKIIFTILSLICLISFVNAAWPFTKYQTCNLLNLTYTDCDSTWCSIIECSYDANKSACICNEGVLINHTETYNKTEIELRLEEIRSNLSNISNQVLNNFSFNYTDDRCYTKEEVNNITITLRDNLMNSQENRTEEIVRKYVGKYDDEDYQKSEPLSPWVFVAIAAIIGAVVAFLAYTKTQQAAVVSTRPKAIPFQKEFINPNKFQGKEEDKKEVKQEE